MNMHLVLVILFIPGLYFLNKYLRKFDFKKLVGKTSNFVIQDKSKQIALF